jgi:zinc protease
MNKFISVLKITLITISTLMVCESFSQVKLIDPIPLNSNIKIGKLSNGLTYYIKKNAKPEKKIELRLVLNVGSILEDDNQLGLAHFMEHMNFNGSKHFPKNDLVNYLQSIGVKFGADLNAYTSFDETVYILPLPSDKPEVVEKGFTVLEDWAGGALLTDEEIEKERGVVLEELRSGKGSQERMRNIYFPELLNGSKYALRLPIGKEDILKTFKPDQLRKFYKDWYRPNLMAIVVVGDIDPAEAEAKIIAHFSSLKNPINERTRPSIIPIPARQKETALSVSDKEGEQTQLQITNYIKPSKDQILWKDYKDNLVRDIFGQMLNARLAELAQKANPPYLFAFSSFGNFVRGYDAFTSAAIMGKGDIKPAINTLVIETERVKKFGFTNAELERAKQSILTNYLNQYNERDKTNSNVVLGEFIRNFLSNEPIPGIEIEYAFVKQVLPEIKISDVNALAKDLESGQKKFVLVTGPEKRDVLIPDNNTLLALVDQSLNNDIKPYEEKIVAASLMEKAPVGGKIISETKDDALGTIQLKLNNGVTVTIKSTDFKNDEIRLSAVRLGGSSLYELKDKYNAAFSSTITTEMGIKDLTFTDLQKFLNGKTVRVSPNISETSEGFNGISSIKDFETMLQLIYLYSTKPRMDEELFQSFISKQKSMMTGVFQNPSYLFMDTLSKVLTQNNPRAIGLTKPDDFNNINLNRTFDIFKEKFSNADGMNYYLVGNIDIKEMKPMIVAYLGSIPFKNTEHYFKDLGVRAPKGEVKFTYKKGKEMKAQAVINFVGETTYDADENVQLQIVNEILQIKVIEKLREEMGGVYGASVVGSINKLPYGRYNVNITIPCGPENVDKLIAATIELIKNLKIDGPTEIDLSKVKENYKKRYEVDVKTNAYWSNIFLTSFINNTDPRRALSFEKRIDGITAEMVKKIAVKYFDFNNYITGILLPE